MGWALRDCWGTAGHCVNLGRVQSLGRAWSCSAVVVVVNIRYRMLGLFISYPQSENDEKRAEMYHKPGAAVATLAHRVRIAVE